MKKIEWLFFCIALSSLGILLNEQNNDNSFRETYSSNSNQLSENNDFAVKKDSSEILLLLKNMNAMLSQFQISDEEKKKNQQILVINDLIDELNKLHRFFPNEEIIEKAQNERKNYHKEIEKCFLNKKNLNDYDSCVANWRDIHIERLSSLVSCLRKKILTQEEESRERSEVLEELLSEKRKENDNLLDASL
jgi:hypothetical protein